MGLCKRKTNGTLKTMWHWPMCCKGSSAVVAAFVVIAVLGKIIAASTTTTTQATTTKKPFLESPLFIGLAAGVGGFIGLLLLLCFLWKCCCSDETPSKSAEYISRVNRRLIRIQNV